jgi:membrane protein implicated in regulation of membrane protease activity
VLFVVSASAFAADMILRYMEKIKNFSMEKRLFKIKGADIPAEKLLPENLTMLFVFCVVMSATGILYEALNMKWYLSLPCSAAGGSFVCFIFQYFVENALKTIRGDNLPKGDNAAGLDGYCVEEIEPGGWGKVRLFHKEREYEVNAASDGEKSVSLGEKVVSVYESGGFYFVMRTNEIYGDAEE